MGFVAEELNETERLNIQRNKVNNMAVVYGKEASMWKVSVTQEKPAKTACFNNIFRRRSKLWEAEIICGFMTCWHRVFLNVFMIIAVTRASE